MAEVYFLLVQRTRLRARRNCPFTAAARLDDERLRLFRRTHGEQIDA